MSNAVPASIHGVLRRGTPDWHLAADPRRIRKATIAITYGLLGLPFGLLAGGLARLLEGFIGWPAAIVAMAIFLMALYLLAPNKDNFRAGIWLVMPFAIIFAMAWSLMSWRQAGGSA